MVDFLKQRSGFHGFEKILGVIASNHSQDLFETMKTASLLQKVHHQDAGVIDPYTVLRMATVNGARALGLGSACGTIEVGKRADLILVDLDAIHNQPI